MGRILVVDDEPNIRLILEMALSEEGHEIFSAGTGKEGLKILFDSPAPDIVLIDLNMPVLNGKDFILLMRKDKRFNEIPVVLLTGSLAGTEDFPPKGTYQCLFEKPFDLFDLIKSVSQLLEKKNCPHIRFMPVNGFKGDFIEGKFTWHHS